MSLYKLRDKGLISHEIKRFRDSVAASVRQLREIRRKLGRLEGMDPLYILDVHIMLLKDRSFLTQVTTFIRTMGVNAEWAVRMAIDKYREIFDKVEDEYIRGRFSDIQYAGQQILRNLGWRQKEALPAMDEGVIVIAADLSPADTAQMKIDRVQGFAIDMGGKTSHTAIVARSLEIPAVLGLERISRSVKTNASDHRRLGGAGHCQSRSGDASPLREKKERLRRDAAGTPGRCPPARRYGGRACRRHRLQH